MAGASRNKRVLVVGPAWVGDMVMAQVLFKHLKREVAHLELDVLAPASTFPLLSRMPEVRTALEMPLSHGQLGLSTRYRLGRALREARYDVALVLPRSFKSALVPFWARIPRRIGWRGELRIGVLTDRRILNKAGYPLMIQRYLALAFPPGAELPLELPRPRLEVLDSQRCLAMERLGVDPVQAPVLALCPGAEYGPAKRWPARHFADVALAKLREGWAVWLFGSPGELEAAKAIQGLTQNRCLNLVGKTTLLEAVDLLSLASAVVSNDSGLMHVAASLERPLVVLYGSSSPDFTPPLANSEMVRTVRLGLDCSPCFDRTCSLGHLDCLQKLGPEMVLRALSEIGAADGS